MVSTDEIMLKMRSKQGEGGKSSPRSRFKPVSAQKGLKEMFKPVIPPTETGSSRSEKKASVSSISSNDYEDKIRALEIELARVRSEKGRLTVNEEKVLSAIRSETVKQGCDRPVITRSMFIKSYKINVRYFDDSVARLISLGIVVKEEVKYSTKVVTYSWGIVN